MRFKISKDAVQSDFVRKVEKLSGEDILACYQCGECTSGCPVSEFMDIKPNQIARMCQLGMEEELLNSKTIWICASCFQCFSRCPRGIDIAKLNETLRYIAMGTEVDFYGPDKVPEDILAEAPQQALVSVFRKFSL